jgi:uncharacterized protein (TIGR02217 family)
MAHLGMTLPDYVEQGAVQSREYSTTIVTTDGGHEVRNARWADPLRAYDVSLVALDRSDDIHAAVVDLYDAALGSLHTFNFHDWTDGTGVLRKVRFDGPLEVTGVANHLDDISFRLIEVKE